MRRTLADTFALISFFTVVGALNERLVAGMSWGEVGRARLAALPVMLFSARPYGMWRDWVMARAAPPHASASRRTIVDTAALIAFQIPIYALILELAGASPAASVKACLGALPMLLFSGRPYGLYLEAVRRAFRA